MDAKQAAALRAAFDPEQIGKLPKPTKRENPKGKCSECGGWHGLPAVHLDYVGHAAVTDRLLSVDPEWTWEPMAHGPNGEPLFTNGGLWINLTVCGVTRPGFGDEGNGKGAKEVIGDAIRNAAMRFGVALDLWSKEDLHASGEEPRSAAKPPQAAAARARTAPGKPGASSPAVPETHQDQSGAGAVETPTPPAPSPEPPFGAPRVNEKQVAALRAAYKVLRDRGAMNDTQLAAALPEGKQAFADLNVGEADELLTKLRNFESNSRVEKETAA